VHTGDVVSLPNLISLSRVPLGAAFLVSERAGVRVAILLAAAATDYLDGWVARRFGRRSRAGELVDPITDKVFVLAVLGSFVRSGAVALWELAVLLARDIVTVLAFVIAKALRLPVRFRARFSGKVVTTLQIATVLVMTVYAPLTRTAVLVTGAASLVAIADYLRFGRRALRAREHGG
jgi:CDP-diacylglycerol--glycerol-3-phosphate 3-phosphatidyltransferase